VTLSRALYQGWEGSGGEKIGTPHWRTNSNRARQTPARRKGGSNRETWKRGPPGDGQDAGKSRAFQWVGGRSAGAEKRATTREYPGRVRHPIHGKAAKGSSKKNSTSWMQSIKKRAIFTRGVPKERGQKKETTLKHDGVLLARSKESNSGGKTGASQGNGRK